MKRIPHKEKLAVELNKPLDLSTVKADDGTCFGKMWDPSTEECQGCADSDVCGILKERTVKSTATQVDDDEGPFLDTAGMHRLIDQDITLWIKKAIRAGDGELSSAELVDGVMQLGGTRDRQSAIERIKRYKATGVITIKQGQVKWIGKR